jgi:2,6-dihydroxypyridine 3-monooxygenase
LPFLTASKSRHQPRVIIVGGSLGGLAAGLFLRESGCDVEIYERAANPLQGSGAGIVLHPATVRAIEAEYPQLSSRTTRVRYIGADGAIVHDDPASFRFTSYSALHKALLRRFGLKRYQLAHEVISFDQDGDEVEVRFHSAPAKRCELLVAADGIHSPTRTALLSEVQSTYAGYVGWRGTIGEGKLSEKTSAVLRDAIVYCVVSHGHILVYPIPSHEGSLEEGQRLVNWVWYRNVEQGSALDATLTDRTGTRRPVSVAAGAVRDESVAQLQAAASVLPAPLAEVVRKTEQPFVQAVFDIAVSRMALDRVALIGDAAFALRPHVAVGTAKAAEDGYTLARAVGASVDDIPAGLRRWEPAQLSLGQSALERAREAGDRAQFEGTWRVGDPLPFGLYVDGDSRMS